MVNNGEINFLIALSFKADNHNPLTKHHKRVNNLYLSIYVPLRHWEKVLQDLPLREAYMDHLQFLSTMRPLTKMKEGKNKDNMVVTV